jgi:dipeptidyl-peptidase 4
MRRRRSVAAAIWGGIALVWIAGPLCAASRPEAGPEQKATRPNLKLADLFPRKSFFGKRPRAMAWSHDDRYLAFLWNPYDDKGWDLWVYDARDHKPRRLTSLELFAAFDRDAKPILERYKKDREEDERRKKLSDEERQKLDDEDDNKDRDRKEPLKQYSGIGEFAWANKADELLFTYRGDIFRAVMGKDEWTRLTQTQEAESDPKYTHDDTGFCFRRGAGLFRMRFDSAVVQQLGPELPPGVTMSGYKLSKDETKLLMWAGKSSGADREVTYITYRDRFAQAKTAARAVADDPFKGEQYLYLYDLNDDPRTNPKHDGKPWEIYRWPAGAEYGHATVADEPWSPDGRKLAFATWKRDKREIEVIVADVEARKLTTIYKTIHSGEHTTPGMVDPFFTPDGKKLVLVLEQSGFRHAHLLDPLTAGAMQLTRGDFEVYPMKVTEDGEWLFVLSDMEHPARPNYYRVDMTDGKMERVTAREGTYSNGVLSHDFAKLALIFGSWKSLPELYVADLKDRGHESAVTASHPGTLEKVNKLTPELFSYKNRNGQPIHGFLFRPPGWKKTDKHPLLIYVYGGPLGVDRQVGDGKFGSDAYMLAMYLAYRNGYLTATIDPRGTSGYGGLFGSANWEAPGKAQVEDLEDGVKYLSENYGVDSKRVGISGWSFGGFQAQMCMYTAPDTFTLGIAGAGPTEWQNYNNWYSGGVIGKSEIGKPDELDKFSLTHLASKLKGPLLLLHGVEDTNVLFQDTIKVYRELLKAGKGPLVELVIDPTGGHGLGGDIRGKDRILIYEAFLRKWWGQGKP